MTFLNPTDEWIDGIQRERLALMWKPDANGAHDLLRLHPYTGKPGRVTASYNGGRVSRHWEPSE